MGGLVEGTGWLGIGVAIPGCVGADSQPSVGSTSSCRCCLRAANSEWVNVWLEHHLFKELAPHSTLIMDNAAFHKTARTRELIQQAGHAHLLLSPYSPDFNLIEQDFATIKKRRCYAPPEQPRAHSRILRSLNFFLLRWLGILPAPSRLRTESNLVRR